MGSLSSCLCKKTASIVIGVLVAVLLAGVAEAATVRGRLERQTPQGRYPAAGIPVSVFRPDIGRSGMSYSGYDGMYYLYNIPDGDYTLEVWVYPNSPPMTFNIHVAGQEFTDIAPIVVP